MYINKQNVSHDAGHDNCVNTNYVRRENW